MEKYEFTKKLLSGLTIIFNGFLVIVSLLFLINAQSFLEGLTSLIFTGFFCISIIALVKWVKEEDE